MCPRVLSAVTKTSEIFLSVFDGMLTECKIVWAFHFLQCAVSFFPVIPSVTRKKLEKKIKKIDLIFMLGNVLGARDFWNSPYTYPT
jgi:hypothetical protein